MFNMPIHNVFEPPFDLQGDFAALGSCSHGNLYVLTAVPDLGDPANEPLPLVRPALF